MALILTSSASLLADQPAPSSASVAERMWQIDLNLLLKHYEQVSAALMELRFERDMADAEEKVLSDKDKKLRAAREQVLVNTIDMTKLKLRRMAEEEVEKAKNIPKKEK